VDREEIVRQCPRGMSGADFYALAAEAATMAAQRKVEEILEKRRQTKRDACEDEDVSDTEEDLGVDYHVIVTQADFLLALRQLKPSVSVQDLSRYSAK